jgi:hypothetical protein
MHHETKEERFATQLRQLIISWFYKRLSFEEMKQEVQDLLDEPEKEASDVHDC